MSDKTSQRTEEEMLDQTFVGYDEEMTVQTEDAAKDTSSSTPAAAPDKKKNQNLLVYGAMGLAAVGFLGFKFLGGSPAPQQQVQEPIQATQQPQQVAQAPQSAPNAVVAATTEPVSVPAQPQVSVPASVPATPEQTATVTPTPNTGTSVTVDPVAQYTGNTTSASLPKVEPKPEVKPEVKVEVQPEVKTVNVEKVAAVTASNAEASSSNEKLLAQFQDMLDRKYDPKFNKIEKSLDEQKEVNKSIEERLARLEAGKSTKVTVKSSNDSSDSTSEVKPVKKIVRKPVVVKHKVETTVQHKNTKVEEGDVLIDRTSVKSKPEIQKIDPVYPKVEIHSVYSGRIWTKNADGTLSTFAVGDKLPTGEVIKKIDEEKERVTTDKRVISQ